jgi:hypothetical protein
MLSASTLLTQSGHFEYDAKRCLKPLLRLEPARRSLSEAGSFFARSRERRRLGYNADAHVAAWIQAKPNAHQG